MTGKQFAEKWLRSHGLFDEDSDYGGMLGEAVLAAWNFVMDQGHSGFSGPHAIWLLGEISKAYNSQDDPIWLEYWASPEGQALRASFMGEPGRSSSSGDTGGRGT